MALRFEIDTDPSQCGVTQTSCALETIQTAAGKKMCCLTIHPHDVALAVLKFDLLPFPQLHKAANTYFLPIDIRSCNGGVKLSEAHSQVSARGL